MATASIGVGVYISTDIDVDSSSRFPFMAQTDRDNYICNQSPYTSFTAGMGRENIALI